jgi:CheY-like chemotaxis protein/anti-sigma regulatory factor (Ser/Thr protein kinase)
MSHELRTPLNAIIGFSELLHLEIPGPLTLLQKDYVQNVLGSGEHLLTLINDILDISKIEAGHMELRLALQPLGAAVDGVSGSAHALAAKRGVSLEIDLAKDLPEMMLDLVRIKQILLNLLSNAIKFTQPGGKVVLRAVASQELVSISVSDTGIGIKNEDLPRLFREFEQIHAGAMSANGTGLGLALTRKLAELHGGRVRVESEFGRGSTFTVDLPTGRNVAKSQAPVKDQGGLPGSAILVVEDDPKAAELLATHLRSAGWSVAVALDAEAAMEKARALRPAAITIDLLMPNVDGWNMLTRLKADPETAAIPVVVVSAVEEPNRGLVLGAADHLVKPVSRDALLRSLAAVGVVAHGLRTDLQKGG